MIERQVVIRHSEIGERRMMRRKRGIAWLAALLLAGLVGCNNHRTEPRHRTIEGIADSINMDTNQVAMRWYNPRKQAEEIVAGTVTDQTEILINGKVARLTDIRVGEWVKVTGRIMPSPNGDVYVATRIELTRDEPTTRKLETGN
jgi:hypothetical protein